MRGAAGWPAQRGEDLSGRPATGGGALGQPGQQRRPTVAGIGGRNQRRGVVDRRIERETGDRDGRKNKMT
jgi:hypothetical protein